MSAPAHILIRVVELFSNSLLLLIFARVILSWIYPNLRNSLIWWVWRLTEPVLEPIRRMLPHMGAVDLSPFVAMLLIFLARGVIIRFLYTWL